MVSIIFILVLLGIVSAIYLIVKMPESKTSKKVPTAPTEKVSSNEDSLFIKDIPLLEFIKEYGPKMQTGTIEKDGKIYHLCKFIRDDGTETRVYFFSQLGVLTPQEIKNRKYELIVGQMKSGKYYLHDKNVESWKEVNI